MGRRRTGRELALQLAYTLDLGGTPPGEAGLALSRLPLHDDRWLGDVEDEPPGRPAEASFTLYDWEEARDFAQRLVRGAWERLGEIDRAVASLAEHWSGERMAVIDRNILRLAAWELLFAPDIPPKATMNEWIEVARKYSTGESAAFVNGLLDRLAREAAGRLAPEREGEAG